MSEKYQSLSVAELRALLKERNAKNISGLRKAQLVQLLDSLDASAASVRKAAPREENAGALQQAEKVSPAPQEEAAGPVRRETDNERPRDGRQQFRGRARSQES